MTRPEDLPDFETPPLNEVVMGIQFAPPPGYQPGLAGAVWALFKEEYPLVELMSPLPPNFETFGLPAQTIIQFGVGMPTQPRFWFLTPKKEELIQFQQDRLLHNWRKVGDDLNPYPRFESIIEKFERETGKLEQHFKGLGASGLSVQQCELNYVNRIYEREPGGGLDPHEWLKTISIPGDPPETFVSNFARVMARSDGTPYGRLLCESTIAFEARSRKFIMLTFTARGIPLGSSIGAALDFLSEARDKIVRLFAEVTTDSAHRAWGRKQ